MSTIREVAQAAGVSTATVSNVLNGRSEKVSDDTRDRVFSAIRSLKYRPTAMEMNQRAISTRNLGLMVPDLTTAVLGPDESVSTGEPAGPLRHGYFRNALDGVLEAAALRGWSVTIFVERLWFDVGLAVRRSYDGRCDGMISLAPQPGNELVEALYTRGTPLVLIGTTPWLEGVSSVDVDNLAIGEMAARHFVELRHECLAYVAEEFEQVSSIERRKSFLLSAKHLGIPESRLHSICAVAAEDGTRGASVWNQIAALDPRPTGLLCWHDGLARDVVSASNRFGFQVPRDVSIISVDDAPEAVSAEPGLTTYRNPVISLGKRAAAMLIDRLTQGRDITENVRFVPELIMRGSSGPAPSALP